MKSLGNIFSERYKNEFTMKRATENAKRVLES